MSTEPVAIKVLRSNCLDAVVIRSTGQSELSLSLKFYFK